MLSIIIPHYNSVHSLKKLLDSIPLQENIEVVVIDDKSNSDLVKFEKLKNDRKYKTVTFLKNETNKKGAGVCRNIGLKYIIGDWVLFADSDDFFVQGFFEVVKKYYDKKNDIVYFSPTSIEVDTNKLANRHKQYEEKVINYLNYNNKRNELLLRYEFSVPWSKLINVNFLRKYNIYFDEIIASNDVMFSAKVGHYSKKIAATDKIIYCVTQNKGSMTNKLNESSFDARLKVKIDYCNFIKSKLSLEDQKYLNLSGRAMLYNAIIYRLGIEKILKTYLILKRNKIEVLNKKYLNPLFLFSKLKKHIINYKQKSRYFTR